MEKLIVGPFKTTNIPTLIVIDALDECKDKEPASAILSILSRYINQIPNIKFFITGRPEPRIRSGFRLESLKPYTYVLRLHNVERTVVDDDIKLYLKAQFTRISKARNDCNLAEDWPGPHAIDTLCKKAAGLFIYASFVVRFIGSPHHQPDERLTLVISHPQDTSVEGGSGIDALYTQTLEQAFQDVDPDEHEFYSRFKSVIGAVLLTIHPLSIKTLCDLLQNCGPPSKVFRTLSTLYPLLVIPESIEDPVCIIHRSLFDYFTDSTRCTDRFFVDPSVHHTEILFSCLGLMRERLKNDPHNPDDSAILGRVKDLSTHQGAYTGDALEYAYCFWTNHLMKIPNSSPHVAEIQKAVDEFSTTHLQCWVEILSLTRNIDTAIYAINNVWQWYTQVSCLWNAL